MLWAPLQLCAFSHPTGTPYFDIKYHSLLLPAFELYLNVMVQYKFSYIWLLSLNINLWDSFLLLCALQFIHLYCCMVFHLTYHSLCFLLLMDMWIISSFFWLLKSTVLNNIAQVLVVHSCALLMTVNLYSSKIVGQKSLLIGFISTYKSLRNKFTSYNLGECFLNLYFVMISNL